MTTICINYFHTIHRIPAFNYLKPSIDNYNQSEYQQKYRQIQPQSAITSNTNGKQPFKLKQDHRNQSSDPPRKQGQCKAPQKTSMSVADEKLKKKEKQTAVNKIQNGHHKKMAPQPPYENGASVKKVDERHSRPQHVSNESLASCPKALSNSTDALIPQYRRFGDTNALRNHKRPTISKLINHKSHISNNNNGKVKYCINRYTQSYTASDMENSVPKVSSGSGNGKCSNVIEHGPNKIENGPPIVRITPMVDKDNRVKSKHGSNISSSNSSSSKASSLIIKESEINKNNTDSYLGPFNFRHLLRPTQGPTESLRKRKGTNLSLTPPPVQKGKV